MDLSCLDDPRFLECYEDVALMDLTTPITPVPFVPFGRSHEHSTFYHDEALYVDPLSPPKYEALCKYQPPKYEPSPVERGLLIALDAQIKVGNAIREQLKGKFRADPFELVSVPKITLSDFTQRIFEFADFEKSAWVVAAVLLERYKSRQWKKAVNAVDSKKSHIPCYWIDSFNSHRLLSVSVLTAVKLNEDDCFSNQKFATLFGITLKDLNLMEKTFCETLQWNLHVDEQMYQKYEKNLLLGQ